MCWFFHWWWWFIGWFCFIPPYPSVCCMEVCITGTWEGPETPKLTYVRCRVRARREKPYEIMSQFLFSWKSVSKSDTFNTCMVGVVWSYVLLLSLLSFPPPPPSLRAMIESCLRSLWSREAKVAWYWCWFLILVDQYKEGFVAFSVDRVVECSCRGQKSV